MIEPKGTPSESKFGIARFTDFLRKNQPSSTAVKGVGSGLATFAFGGLTLSALSSLLQESRSGNITLRTLIAFPVLGASALVGARMTNHTLKDNKQMMSVLKPALFVLRALIGTTSFFAALRFFLQTLYHVPANSPPYLIWKNAAAAIITGTLVGGVIGSGIKIEIKHRALKKPVDELDEVANTLEETDEEKGMDTQNTLEILPHSVLPQYQATVAKQPASPSSTSVEPTEKMDTTTQSQKPEINQSGEERGKNNLKSS